MLIIWEWTKKIRILVDTYAIYILREISKIKEEVKGFKKGLEAIYNFSKPLMFEIGMLSE